VGGPWWDVLKRFCDFFGKCSTFFVLKGSWFFSNASSIKASLPKVLIDRTGGLSKLRGGGWPPPKKEDTTETFNSTEKRMVNYMAYIFIPFFWKFYFMFFVIHCQLLFSFFSSFTHAVAMLVNHWLEQPINYSFPIFFSRKNVFTCNFISIMSWYWVCLKSK